MCHVLYNAPMTLAPSPTPLTVPEIDDDGNGPLFEIVDGVRVEKPMSAESQWVGTRIARRVGNYCEAEGIPDLVITETFVACFDWMPGTKRRPDVAYWRPEQLPGGLPSRGELAIAPAWVVEVVSPNDVVEDLYVKLAEYFRAGVELIWVVTPMTRSVRAEQPDGTAHVYRAERGEQILAAPVLPGFSVAVADLFPPTAPATAPAGE